MDPFVKARDGGDGEAVRLLCFRLLEGASFRIPLDQEYLHVGGSFFVMRRGGHLSKTLLILALSPLASLPRRGSLVTVALRLRTAFLFSDRRCRGVGKWSMSFEGCYDGPASAGGGGLARA